MAVLGAAAGLGRQDALDLDGVAAPGHPDGVGRLGQGRDVAVGQRRQHGQLVEGELAAVADDRQAGRRDQLGAGGARLGRGRHGGGGEVGHVG